MAMLSLTPICPTVTFLSSDMRAIDVDVAMEKAMALPEFVLLEDDDIVKATAFRFVYIQHALSFTHCRS